MDFAISVFPNELRQSVQAVAAMVRLAEQAGFSEAWIGDSQGIWKDPYVCLGACALQTTRIKLGIGVTNVRTRHLAVTARAMATVDELSGGRGLLGIGAGDTAFLHLDWKPATVATCREAVHALRSLLAGDTATWQGWTIEPLQNLACGPVPIYLAASGPRMLELAGEVADGCIASAGLTPEYLCYVQHHWGVGEKRRQTGRCEFVLQTGGAIADDDAQAAREASTIVARKMLQPVPREVTKFDAQASGEMKHRYRYQEHLSAGAAHGPDLPPEVVRDYVLAGTPATVRQQIAALETLGITKLMIVPVGLDTCRLIEGFAQEIIPMFAGVVPESR